MQQGRSCTVCALLAQCQGWAVSADLLSPWLVFLLGVPEAARLGTPWAGRAAVWPQTKGTRLSLQSKHDSFLMVLVPMEI